jgi:hypothetical protein
MAGWKKALGVADLEAVGKMVEWDVDELTGVAEEKEEVLGMWEDLGKGEGLGRGEGLGKEEGLAEVEAWD